jgi:hypothetical protein
MALLGYRECIALFEVCIGRSSQELAFVALILPYRGFVRTYRLATHEFLVLWMNSSGCCQRMLTIQALAL